jgi:hypothetical protein
MRPSALRGRFINAVDFICDSHLFVIIPCLHGAKDAE